MNVDYTVEEARFYLRWVGDIWRNCGDTVGQKISLQADKDFQNTMANVYGQEFTNNIGLMNNLTSNLGQIIAKGPSQQGYSPAELASMNSQAINAAAAGNQKLQTVIGENAAMHGGGAPGVESGVEQAERAAAATGVDTALTNQEANITQQNYQTGQQNYWKAVQGQEEAPGAFENPLSSTASGVNTANEAYGQEAQNNAQSSLGTELLGLGEGLGQDAASAFSAYEGAHR
jgi:hypothetical protein